MGPDTSVTYKRSVCHQTALWSDRNVARTQYTADDVDYDSVGVAFDNADVKVINPDSNGVGEIIAKSTGMFTGYLNNQAAYDEDVQDG